MSPRRRKILKVAAYIAVGFAAVLVVLLIAFRIALARAPEYRAQVQNWVSERTHLAIEFAHMDARWRFYGPELVFDDAVVRSQDRKRTFVRARRVSLAFDFWTAMSTGRLAAGRVTLEAPELQAVRTVDGRYEFVGQTELPERDRTEPFEPDDLPTGRLLVVDARVSFRDLKSGRGPWVIPGVSFDFRRSGSAMHIGGQAALPANLGKSLHFTADSAGKLARAQTLDWQFLVDAREFDLAGWAQVMPADWPAPRRGRGSLQLSGSLRGARPNDLTMQLLFENVTLALPEWKVPEPAVPTLDYRDDDSGPQTVEAAPESTPAPTKRPDTVDYSRVAFELHLRHSLNDESESWDTTLTDFQLSRKQQPWQSKSIGFKFTRAKSGAIEVTGKADTVVLENLWPLLAYAPESERLALLRAIDAQGRVNDLEIRVVRHDQDTPVEYTARGRFTELYMHAAAKLPGLQNFAGQFAASESGGQAELQVADGALELPRIFRAPLPANKITGRLSWQHEHEGWRIAAESLQIESPDGRAEASGNVFVPSNGGSPSVDLKARGADLDARAAPRYMPAGKMPSSVLAWLDRAFPVGQVPHAEFEMHGPTRSFPFRNRDGLFLIQAHIEGLTLNYQSGWTPATDLTVDAEFRNEGMSAQVHKGDVRGLQIESASARFLDFKHAELLLEAKAHGDLSQALPYLQETPIGPAVGTLFMGLHGNGPLQTRVQLALPFANIDKRKVSVNARVQNATVSLDGLEQSATSISGELSVQDFTVKSLAFEGGFLGGRVEVKGGADGRYYGRGAGLTLEAAGSARGTELARFLRLPSSILLDGAMDWRLQARQPRHAPDAIASRSCTIESDTKGFGIGLPEPIGKAADSSRALRFDIDAPDDDQVILHGAFGDARVLARIVKDADGWRFDRGGLRADGQAAALPAHSGLRIEGSIERLVLDDWLKLKGDGGGKSKLSDYLRAANVHVGTFGYLGYEWPDVRTILQAGEDNWRVDVASDDIAGQLTIPFEIGGSEPLRFALSKLSVGERSEQGPRKLSSDSDPRDVPAIAGRIDELWLSGRKVGSARFALEKNSQGVKLTSGELRGASFTATAQGAWQATTAGSLSSLTVDVASTDVRETLRAFNFHDVISGKRANGHAVLSWPGGVDENLLSRASGTVHIDVSDGQLLDVDPGGPARLLGLMSIAALPRRLALDFGDVTDKGFRFDVAKADFELKSGDAFTNNLILRGPSAEIGIAGRTGLAKHDYDLTAAAAGDIGGSLSVASTVVGGPVVGAAVLAFTRLFKEPLKGVTRRYYRIEGSWDNAHIERIDKQEAKQEAVQTAQPGNEARAIEK